LANCSDGTKLNLHIILDVIFPQKFIAFALPGAYNLGLLKTGWNNAENALFAMKPGTA
jgi:hypothetical protein